MKRCPKCNLKYGDTLSFCLEDGAALIANKDPDETLVLPHTQPQPTLPAMHFQSPAVPADQPTEKSSNRTLYAIILLLAVFAAGVTVALFYEHEKPMTSSSNVRQSQTATPIDQSVTETSTPASPRRVNAQTTAPASETSQNLTGEWNLIDTVQKTSYGPYTNAQVGYRLFIKHSGREITAEGEKSWVNGKLLAPNQRTAIHVSGSVDGRNITATFVEDGIRRTTTGTFNWNIENQGRLTGTFVSTAATTSGSSIATKQK